MPYVLYLFLDGHLRYLHILPIMTNAMNIEMHLSFQISVFVFVRYIPMSRIAGSYDSSVSSFLRKLHTIFHNSFAKLHTTSSAQFPFLHIFAKTYLLGHTYKER